MDNQQNQRLLYDTECKDCNRKTICEYSDTQQCCRKITDKLRFELRNKRIAREIVSKIIINTEYIFSANRQIKTVAKEGSFILKEPYRFGTPFLRTEIQGKDNGGEFSTKYYKWNKN